MGNPNGQLLSETSTIKAASTEKPSMLIAQQARSKNLQVLFASPTHKAMHKTDIKEGAADP